MSEKLLACVRVVCDSDPRIGALPHVTYQIDAFRFSIHGGWTLESASKHGFVGKLDQLHSLEPKRDREFHFVRFCTAVFSAIKNGYDVCVMEWWLNTYRPESRNLIVTDIFSHAAHSRRLDVLKWLYRDNEGHLPKYVDRFSCSDPEIAYWLFEHGRHLPMEFPMYECSAADPSFEFAKWCLTQQEFKCDQPEEAVCFAIDHDQEDYLRWLFDHHLELFQRNHLDRSICNGRLKFAKWLLEKFPRHFFLDPSTPLATTVLGADYDQVLELIKWVAFELKWQNKNARASWMSGVMTTVAGTGKTNLVPTLQIAINQLSNSNLKSSLVEAAAANGRELMLQWLHDTQRQGFQASVIWRFKETKAMDKAASNGHLDVVKWLHEHRYKGCTTDAMDNAAMNGHLDVVKWLHENRTEGCTTKAMHLAAINGHLEVVEWLQENRTEGCDQDTIPDATLKGHFQVVQFLYLNCIKKSARRSHGRAAIYAMLNPFGNSNFEVYQWLRERALSENWDWSVHFY